MSQKHKSRLETLRDYAPEMLSVIRSTRDILHNALNDDYFDRDVFERLQKRVIAVLDLKEQDAMFIAKAPEMYEMLKDCADYLEDAVSFGMLPPSAVQMKINLLLDSINGKEGD